MEFFLQRNSSIKCELWFRLSYKASKGWKLFQEFNGKYLNANLMIWTFKYFQMFCQQTIKMWYKVKSQHSSSDVFNKYSLTYNLKRIKKNGTHHAIAYNDPNSFSKFSQIRATKTSFGIVINMSINKDINFIKQLKTVENSFLNNKCWTLEFEYEIFQAGQITVSTST